MANESVTQIIHVVTDQQKPDLLRSTLRDIGIHGTQNVVPSGTFNPEIAAGLKKEGHDAAPASVSGNKTESTKLSSKCLVFVRTKRDCDRVANELWELGFACDALHGDKEQYERTRILRSFERSDIKLLFATDVAARGLDVSDITHVINYDFPLQKGKAGVEDYVHRIGRTGRAGKTGTAITFFTRQNSKNAAQLVQLLKDAKQTVPPELQSMCWGRGRGGGRGRGRWGRGGRGRGYGGRYGRRTGGFRGWGSR